jgi:hypothetical protein
MRTATTAAFAAALVLALAASPAFATNGYFSHGYGTPYKGMAGAGVALPLNSLAPATNPAAMAFLSPRWDASLAPLRLPRHLRPRPRAGRERQPPLPGAGAGGELEGG